MGSTQLDTNRAFNGVKVFSATMVAQRERLGESVTEWLAARPQLELVDMRITQSSDAQFHCIAITVFYNEPLPARR
jgi:hypothetical protein